MSQRRNRILEEWISYKAAVYHGEIPDKDQERQLKMAFYGGAVAAKHVILRDLDPGDAPTQADYAILLDMQAELREFSERVRKKMS